MKPAAASAASGRGGSAARARRLVPALPPVLSGWRWPALWLLLLLLVTAGCAPALDWRDVRPAGSGLTLQMPCRPSPPQQRAVPLAGPAVGLTLEACTAAGQTFGIVWADVADPARVGPALMALRAAAAANVAADAALALPAPEPFLLPGATPNAGNGRMRLAGRLPDGAAVQMQLVVFARGTRVYQASVLGAAVTDEAAENYFGSMRFGR